MRRRWFRRCWTWTIGPFMTEWRCLLDRGHDGRHKFEPDVWIEDNLTARAAASSEGSEGP